MTHALPLVVEMGQHRSGIPPQGTASASIEVIVSAKECEMWPGPLIVHVWPLVVKMEQYKSGMQVQENSS